MPSTASDNTTNLESHASAIDQPWVDEDGRPSLGWIVRTLESSLSEVKEDERRAVALWNYFDQTFGSRADYDCWRKLGLPAFWRQGRSPKLHFLRPRNTIFYETDNPPSLDAAMPTGDAFRQSSWNIRQGIIGTMVDWINQNRPRPNPAFRAPHASPENLEYLVPPETISMLDEYTAQILNEIPPYFRSPMEALIYISLYGTIGGYAKFTGENLRQKFVPLVQHAFSTIDPYFDQMALNNRIPEVRFGSLVEIDRSGMRFLPCNWEDHLNIFCSACHGIDSIFEYAQHRDDFGDDTEYLASLRLRASIMAACAMVCRRQRIQFERQAKERAWENFDRTLGFLYRVEVLTFRVAAEVAEQSDRTFLAAALWRIYLWSADRWRIQVPRCPQRVFRLLRDTGFRINSNTRWPKRIDVNPRAGDPALS